MPTSNNRPATRKDVKDIVTKVVKASSKTLRQEMQEQGKTIRQEIKDAISAVLDGVDRIFQEQNKLSQTLPQRCPIGSRSVKVFYSQTTTSPPQNNHLSITKPPYCLG